MDKLSFTELLYGLIFNPVETFRNVSRDLYLSFGFIIFISITLLTSLFSVITPTEITDFPPELREFISSLGVYFVLMGALLSFGWWLVEAGVLQLFAEFMGGKGSALHVLTVLAFAKIPRVLVIPIQLIAYFTEGSFAGKFLAAAAGILVFVWELILTIIGLRETQQFTTGRAAATLLIPVGLIGAIITVLFLVMVWMAAPFLRY